MSRSGYDDDGCENWTRIKWRGQVASAIRGKRGQAFLMEMLDALEAMPEKRLIANSLQREVPAFIPPNLAKANQVCALGAVGLRRGINLETLGPDDYNAIAKEFGIARQLVQEIEYENDENSNWNGQFTPEQRWQYMHDWAMKMLRPVPVVPSE
jgi:hypothetical protein